MSVYLVPCHHSCYFCYFSLSFPHRPVLSHSHLSTSYPLIFLGVRNQVLVKVHQTFENANELEHIYRPVVAALLLAFINLGTLFLTDIGFVGSLAGSTFGTAMAFIFPSLMYVGALRKKNRSLCPIPSPKVLRKRNLAVIANLFLALLGATLSGVGTTSIIKSIGK